MLTWGFNKFSFVITPEGKIILTGPLEEQVRTDRAIQYK